jgi:DNA-binding GntR family transcriptional regulator
MQTEELTELLREDIRTGVLRAGQALVQEELAKRFSVSRIPIREALLTLAAGGIVTARPGGGHAVRSLSPREVEELYDLRILIEPSLSTEIVANASPNDLRSWRRMASELRIMKTPGKSWVTKNYQFHLAIYDVTERDHTIRVIRSLLDLTLPYSRLFMSETGESDKVDDEHDQMLQAIEDRNAKLLRDTLSTHLHTTQRSVSAFLKKSMPAEAS